MVGEWPTNRTGNNSTKGILNYIVRWWIIFKAIIDGAIDENGNYDVKNATEIKVPFTREKFR